MLIKYKALESKTETRLKWKKSSLLGPVNAIQPLDEKWQIPSK